MEVLVEENLPENGELDLTSTMTDSTVKKKNRRKLRKKKPIPEDDIPIPADNSTPKISPPDFKISAVVKTAGTVVRKKEKTGPIRLEPGMNYMTNAAFLPTVQNKTVPPSKADKKAAKKFPSVTKNDTNDLIEKMGALGKGLLPESNQKTTDVKLKKKKIEHPITSVSITKNPLEHISSEENKPPLIKKIAKKKKLASTATPSSESSPKKMNSPKKENVMRKPSTSTSPPNETVKQENKVLKKKKSQKPDQNNKEKPEPKFDEYWPIAEVEKGLKDGTLVKGALRINPKFYTEAYVSNDDKSIQDYFIGSVADRNRALEDDIVVLKVLPESEWRDNQKKAKVVYIFQKVHSRQGVGYLKLIGSNNKQVASFQPRDKRIPHMNVVLRSLPETFMKNPKEFDGILFLAELVDWKVPKFGDCVVLEHLGRAKDLKSETRALLCENSIVTAPFTSEMKQCLPASNTIDPKEFTYREDLREECIFTIDPLTAKDLDDAVSCKVLINGNYEIGVHIADVAFYLTENTILDNMVMKRATSTYLVDQVVHMLPLELCTLCSLLPGKDCLAFSVIFEMTDSGEVLKRRFTRSVINSCTQFAYEHAQAIIDDPINCEQKKKFPRIYKHSFEKIKDIILILHRIAKNMRQRRFHNGSLRIDQIKLGFHLDSHGDPSSYIIQEMKEANHLIEEYMLLANIEVGKKIYERFPKLAFLRNHQEPNSRLLNEVKKSLETVGLHLNIDSSNDLHNSLAKYNTNDALGVARYIALNHLLAKPMIRAQYFCAAMCDSRDFHHYALAVPIYTHFTSPIRRYADVMVHRLLAAALEYSPVPQWTPTDVHSIANRCNTMKYNAKKASESSISLYFAAFVEKHQPFVREAVVVAVTAKSFDAIVIQTGTNVRVYFNALKNGITVQMIPSSTLIRALVTYAATKTLPEFSQVVDLFQIVRVSLKRVDKSNKLEAQLVRPNFNGLPNKHY